MKTKGHQIKNIVADKQILTHVSMFEAESHNRQAKEELTHAKMQRRKVLLKKRSILCVLASLRG